MGMALRAGPGILCRWEQFDKKYLSQLLMRRSAYRIRDQIWDVYYRLNIRDAISFVDQVGLQPVVGEQVARRARREGVTDSRLNGLVEWQLQEPAWPDADVQSLADSRERWESAKLWLIVQPYLVSNVVQFLSLGL